MFKIKIFFFKKGKKTNKGAMFYNIVSTLKIDRYGKLGKNKKRVWLIFGYFLIKKKGKKLQ
jgi:hypothetical protein